MQITEVTAWGVRSAVITMGHRAHRLRFILFPMVHMGRPEFYREVTERLRRCDLIVAEGADIASSTGLSYVIALRLVARQSAKGLVHQDIDYAALGVPTIYPEKLLRVKRRRWRMHPMGWLDILWLTPVLVAKFLAGGRHCVLRRLLEINDDDYFTRGWWIKKRDTELVRELMTLYRRRRDDTTTIAVVYGAAHMPAVVNALANRGYRPLRAAWLSVIPR